jgi:hypothetical protein
LSKASSTSIAQTVQTPATVVFRSTHCSFTFLQSSDDGTVTSVGFVLPNDSFGFESHAHRSSRTVHLRHVMRTQSAATS